MPISLSGLCGTQYCLRSKYLIVCLAGIQPNLRVSQGCQIVMRFGGGSSNPP